LDFLSSLDIFYFFLIDNKMFWRETSH